MKIPSKIFISLFICLTMMGYSSSVSAQGTKIGYVDTPRLMKEAPQVIASQKMLEEEFSERQQMLKSYQQEIADLEADIQKNSLIMSSDEQSQKERRLRELQRLLKRGSEEYREDVSLRRNEELTKVQIIVREAVMTVAVAEGYNLIVEFPVYASPEVNITNKVLDQLSKQR
ncbi:MAG: OmpH family outer membrane protein [Arenicellales bacterium]|jgi:outer membrane protein|nr:OmpH family outer membrane protein [Arenicellales bacterium]MDP6435570.1 OmpH family outer membrane protein [Arenicellales bacterium]MDP6723815.1 OmpH family outer membrane protein [Arenicellales bacterium]|tara:strand:- start:687 stop:1202 length:516 start_codon:yes stop_codon:yes gene_type:complete